VDKPVEKLLAVILHRMWIDETSFHWSSEGSTAWAEHTPQPQRGVPVWTWPGWSRKCLLCL